MDAVLECLKSEELDVVILKQPEKLFLDLCGPMCFLMMCFLMEEVSCLGGLK